MFIAEVAPLIRIPRASSQVFSYFVPRELPQGALVEVSIGRRVVQGIVLGMRPVRASKLEIRKSAFTIKSVKKVITDAPAYSARALELAQWVSNQYWAPLGSALALFVPLESGSAVRTEAQTAEKGHSPVFIQEAQRASAYAERMQAALRENKPVLVLCSDVYALKAMHEALSAQISNAAVFAYGGTRSKKKIKEVLAALQNNSTPSVIIGTRSALFLPFFNLGLIIVGAAGSASYEAWGRAPRYHAVEVAEKLAALHGAQLVYGDCVPSVSLWQKMQSGILQKPISYTLSAIRCDVIDMRRQTHWSSRHPISLQLKDTLRRTLRSDRLHEPNYDGQTRKQILVLINRKGVATAFVCRKCGHIPRCKTCDTAMVLHGAEAFSKTAAGVLRCHHCGFSTEPPKQCPQCASYRIWPIGSGTMQIERDIKNIAPEARVLRIDSDAVKSETELLRRMQAFCNHEADVLIGTQMMLKEALLPRVALSIVLGAEQFFVFPGYAASERAWHMFETLRQKTTEQMVIQTLNTDMPMFAHFPEGRYAEFLDAELEERKTFAYPPFGELAKLTFSHAQRSHASFAADHLADQFKKSYQRASADYALLGPSPAFVPRERGKWKFVILLKFPADAPLEQRNTILELVPPGWQVEINPRELL